MEFYSGYGTVILIPLMELYQLRFEQRRGIQTRIWGENKDCL